MMVVSFFLAGIGIRTRREQGIALRKKTVWGTVFADVGNEPPSGEARERGSARKNPYSPAKKRTKQSLRSFFIQSEGLVCNLTEGEYVIAEGVWHHALACIFLRIDYMHHVVMITYTPWA
jgi:hypothetical protein